MSALLEAFDVSWTGRAVLLVASHDAEHARRICAERGATRADVLALDGLAAGLPEPGEYDIAVVGDVLYRRTPTEVHDVFRWITAHLTPGGECLVETRTYLAPDGGDLAPDIHTPYAHLAFARDVIEEYCAERALPSPPVTNPMCLATYFMMLRRAGLEIGEVQVEAHDPTAFGDKLRFYDAAELRVSRFRARLRRPVDASDALAELRETLKTQ